MGTRRCSGSGGGSSSSSSSRKYAAQSVNIESLLLPCLASTPPLCRRRRPLQRLTGARDGALRIINPHPMSFAFPRFRSLLFVPGNKVT